MKTTKQHLPHRHSSSILQLRLKLVEFLIKTSTQLQVSPMVKYSALSLLINRFYPSLFTSQQSHSQNWLLNPIRESNLQLFALISIWISTKFHNSPPLSIKTLKSISDRQIFDQHFTNRDFLDAEILFLQRLNFEIGSLNRSAFVMLEELMMKLRVVARVGEFVSFEACLDVMDLLYQDEEISRLFVESPLCVAAGVLVASYVMTVPKQEWEFPLLSWVNFVTCRENDILWIVKRILHHILGP